MTQTALTSQKTSGRADRRKFTTYTLANRRFDSHLALDYCAELANAFRLTPSARSADAPEDTDAGGSTACLVALQRPQDRSRLELPGALLRRVDLTINDLTNRGDQPSALRPMMSSRTMTRIRIACRRTCRRSGRSRRRLPRVWFLPGCRSSSCRRRPPAGRGGRVVVGSRRASSPRLPDAVDAGAEALELRVLGGEALAGRHGCRFFGSRAARGRVLRRLRPCVEQCRRRMRWSWRHPQRCSNATKIMMAEDHDQDQDRDADEHVRLAGRSRLTSSACFVSSRMPDVVLSTSPSNWSRRPSCGPLFSANGRLPYCGCGRRRRFGLHCRVVGLRRRHARLCDGRSSATAVRAKPPEGSATAHFCGAPPTGRLPVRVRAAPKTAWVTK